MNYQNSTYATYAMVPHAGSYASFGIKTAATAGSSGGLAAAAINQLKIKTRPQKPYLIINHQDLWQ